MNTTLALEGVNAVVSVLGYFVLKGIAVPGWVLALWVLSSILTACLLPFITSSTASAS
jgi:hypothetical protein